MYKSLPYLPFQDANVQYVSSLMVGKHKEASGIRLKYQITQV